MRALLQALAAAGKTVFVSSNILPEIEQMADEVAIIAHGRLISAGRLDRLLLGTSGEVRIHVDPDAVPHATDLLGSLVSDVHPNGHGPGWLSVTAAPTRAAELNRTLVGAGIDVSGLEVGSDLEALFLSLTESA